MVERPGQSPSHAILVSECEHPATACVASAPQTGQYVVLECRRCGKRLTVAAYRILVAHSLRHRAPTLYATIPSSGLHAASAEH